MAPYRGDKGFAIRFGIGWDAHPFVEGRRLILGGVEVPHHCGLGGHSDADVLCHAVADALLGALALGDIGTLFPDTDPRYEGARSLDLLREVARRVREEGGEPINIDAVIIAQEPRLAPYVPEMRRNLAQVVGLPEGAVSVKPKRPEGLGALGRGEGISALAIASVRVSL
ncbi:MAG TPA: 2-C-methyl-D-erythritol 2,4-cyclodiphosphate synthase [Armatimonadetes bacterium]|nr:2-C-methyl-D-erythritol 2,4-cyclodiphosphate synthase [Armatimonadota bacterium]